MVGEGFEGAGQVPADADAPNRSSAPPRSPAFSPAGFELSAREHAVAAELSRVDPQLAGLFRIGIELCERGEVPGNSYVIAEAGRELSVGIISLLAEGAPELSSAESATIAEGEKHRGSIARALRLHPQNPLVTAWLEMHQRFNGEAHFVANRVTTSTAAADFRELASLTAGRIAPYFDAQDEADAILAIEHPTPHHQNDLKRILVRPALRRYFLQKLRDPKWLPVLERLKVFDHPPGRTVHPDGSWSLVSWLEGEYLVQVAATAPRAVAVRIEAIPLENDNPAVWDAAARAAALLPAEQAAPVLRHIALGLRSLPRVVLPAALLALGEHVAIVDSGPVLLLLSTLLWMRRREVEGESGEADGSQRYLYSTAWLLERIDLYDAQEALERLVPSIASVDPRGVLELLGAKLRAAMRSVDAAYADETARESRWYSSLEESASSDDVRALFVRAIARVAKDYSSASAENASWVIHFLSSLPKGIGQRLHYFVVGHVAPQLTIEVDRLLQRPDVLEWEMPGREVGDVLRRRFSDAGVQAQREFLRTLTRGPADDYLDQLIEWFSETGGNSTRETALAYWQRRQLKRFGKHVPELLLPLAEQLSYVPSELAPQDLDLIEIGWSSGSAGWVRESSPFSSESLLTESAENVARSILEWIPDGNFDRPTLRGLEDEMQRLAVSAPDRSIELATAILRAGGSRGVSGVLWGLSQRLKQGGDAPAASIADLLRMCIESDLTGPEWETVTAAAIDLAREWTINAAFEPTSDLFPIVSRLLSDPRLWKEDADDETCQTMEGVLVASMNALSGRTTELVVRLALAEYNHRRREGSDASHEAMAIRSEIAVRVLPAVQSILTKHGRAGLAARAVIGTYLPQLLWFAPEWLSEQSTALLDDATASPTSNPVWAAYLARAGFVDSAFVLLRPWYAQAIANPLVIAGEGPSRTWEPERHLVEHVLIALLRGLASIGENDNLIENTFAHAPAEDISHGLWTIFRGWSDASEQSESVPVEYVARLVDLWRWRLSQLEGEIESERLDEEANGLLWLCLTPWISVQDVIMLGVRTLRLVRNANGTLHLLWRRLEELAAADPDGTYLMMERAVEIELTSKWPRVPEKELGPVFRAAFSLGSASTQSAALLLLNRLGDEGYPGFGRFRPVL
ncbi:MAG: hypothetical protein JWO05_3861 [Gemmatimonadetes bacterium]|nr:hypothetical protein [Gemmatimonadota bacterium]